MTTAQNSFKFKGDAFENRYRIQGLLTATAPLHVGTGEDRPDDLPRKDQPDNEEPPRISEIARDFSGMPYLPGSSLRGVVRHYLLQIFGAFLAGIARDPDFENGSFEIIDQDQQRRRIKFKDLDQAGQVIYLQRYASLLEQLFGTPFSESKIDFWDAALQNRVQAAFPKSKGWDNARQSYVVRSVAIDPQTGVAEANKLYSFDVVPTGAAFDLNVVGQNLSDVELGFLLFGLDGFNSEIFPLTLGAMAGRGFGRMKFELKAIYRLTASELPKWAKDATRTNHAGYQLSPTFLVPEKDKLIAAFKQAFSAKLGGQS